MSYVRTAGMSTAGRRKRRRAAIILTVLLTLLLAAGIYAFAYYMDLLPRDAPSDEAQDTEQVTATAEAPQISPEEVTVNVYNASGVTGIAGRTSEALSAQGYAVDTVADAPDDFETPEVAQIIHGAEGAEGAALLAELVPGAEIIDDDREGDGVDLFIGEGFEEISAEGGEDEGGDGEGNNEDGADGEGD